MADVFNKNPSEYVDMNEFFPILNDKVGLTYEQWRKLVENVNYIKNNSDNIKELVGTNSKPINFAYDMEVGKLYNCKGLVYVDSSSVYDLSSHIERQDGFVLIYKSSLESVISVAYGYVWIFDSNGNILKQSGIKIFSINNRDNGFFSLYTPETSGLQGQILQSNGNDSAPTWLSVGDGLSVENGVLSASGSSGGGSLSSKTLTGSSISEIFKEVADYHNSKKLLYITITPNTNISGYIQGVRLLAGGDISMYDVSNIFLSSNSTYYFYPDVSTQTQVYYKTSDLRLLFDIDNTLGNVFLIKYNNTGSLNPNEEYEGFLASGSISLNNYLNNLTITIYYI